MKRAPTLSRIQPGRSGRITTLMLTALSLSALTACPELVEPPFKIADPQDPRARPEGATEFWSADGRAGQETADSRQDPSAPIDEDADFESGAGEEENRTVEEGDIYRVLGGGYLLNLNGYRGVQIIDMNDVENPKIVGRYRVSGHPVEMYVDGDRAYVLLNDWTGYWGARDDINIEQRRGGLVLSLDISDKTAPALIDRSYIPGYIRKSRMTKGNTSAALYVATGGYDYFYDEDGNYHYEYTTYVQSYDVGDGALNEKSLLDLGGYVTDIQATTDALMVATFDYQTANEEQGGSHVVLVDISDPHGSMLVGADVTVRGRIETQFNMNKDGDVLRVVSSNFWGADADTNFVQTFDVSDLNTALPLDSAEFGEGEQLYATIFLGEKAFFVTYEQVDPFHAFHIGSDGIIEEKSEFIVSGWNDFFRPVENGSRLIGIGKDDADGAATLAVSLYNITDLENPEPLIERANVAANGWSWSEANWDHRAFSVLENVVDVTAPNDAREKGIVLLPFSGYDQETGTYRAAVQIFTFSSTSLTQRGIMEHGSFVRRSFQAEGTTANLSETELSLFDAADPNDPTELGRVELSANYTDLLRYGDYRVRVKDNGVYYWWWGYNADLPQPKAEIILASEDPDAAETIASIEIPNNAQLTKTGDLLVATSARIVDTEVWPYEVETDILVIDLSDPTVPVQVSTLTSDELKLGQAYDYWWYYDDCFDCGYYYYPTVEKNDVAALDNGMAYLQRNPKSELLGMEEICNTYPTHSWDCYELDENETCVYFSGGETCRSLNGGPVTCTGDIQRCEYTAAEGTQNCVPVDPEADNVGVQTNCYDYEKRRYWTSFSVAGLDLSDPASPSITMIDLPEDDEGISMLAEGDSLWLSYQRPVEIEGDPLPYVKSFIREVSFSSDLAPLPHASINVPGELLAKEGASIVTRDLVWGEEIVETALNRLKLEQGLAFLQSVKTFNNQVVYGALLDGAGHIAVSHRIAYNAYNYNDYYSEENFQKLTLLDDSSLSVSSETNIDAWGTMQHAEAGRVVFNISGGLLLMNTENASAPTAQAYFPTRGWPRKFVFDGDTVLIPSGHHGVYSFDLDAFNLVDDL